MFKNILIALSGTGRAEEMMQMLLKIEPIQQAHLTVLTVIPEAKNPQQAATLRADGEILLDNAVKKLNRPEGQIETLLKEGDAKTIVCKVADDLNADLIIMGSRGLKRLQSILQNSVSQYVFQLSSHSMLLVKDDIFITRINRIMVAFNSENPSEESLKLALEILRDIPGGELLLAHTGNKAGKTEPDADPVLAEAIAQAKRLNIGYRCFSEGGDPSRKLCQLAESAGANLLILDSPERRPSIAKTMPDLDRLIGTSVSDYTRVNAPCPVVLARK